MREYKPGPLYLVETRRLEIEAETLCGPDRVRKAKTEMTYQFSSALPNKRYMNHLRWLIEEAKDDD